MFSRYKRAQASMEFLSMYSWSLVVIFLLVGALAYFVIFNPSLYVEEVLIDDPRFQITTTGTNRLIIKNIGEQPFSNVVFNASFACKATPLGDLLPGQSVSAYMLCRGFETRAEGSFTIRFAETIMGEELRKTAHGMLAVQGSFVPFVSPDALQDYWAFDHDINSVLGNPTTYQGEQVPGIRGSAFSGHAFTEQIGNEGKAFTWIFLVKPEILDNSMDIFLTSDQTLDDTNMSFLITTQWDGDRIRFSTKKDGSTYTAISPVALTQEAWNFVAVRFTEGTIYFNINGNVGLRTIGAESISQWNGIHIGANIQDDEIIYPLRGAIDEIMIYNTSLHHGDIELIRGYLYKG